MEQLKIKWNRSNEKDKQLHQSEEKTKEQNVELNNYIFLYYTNILTFVCKYLTETERNQNKYIFF
jgi:hypothetical protein